MNQLEDAVIQHDVDLVELAIYDPIAAVNNVNLSTQQRVGDRNHSSRREDGAALAKTLSCDETPKELRIHDRKAAALGINYTSLPLVVEITEFYPRTTE